MPVMWPDARWVRIALAVLLLVAFGACLVHADGDDDEHGLNPHACAAMLLVASAMALTKPLAGRRVRIETSHDPRQTLLRLLDPPPEVPALA
jgi:hypothetical protein